jgi:hypothetical protein
LRGSDIVIHSDGVMVVIVVVISDIRYVWVWCRYLSHAAQSSRRIHRHRQRRPRRHRRTHRHSRRHPWTT